MLSNWKLRLKRQLRMGLAPHEKALLGTGSWGRQEAKAVGQANMTFRVYRAATDSWEEKGAE